MSNQQGGLSAEEIIRKEAIDRITDYQTSVQGMIKLNIELEKITREMVTSDIKGKRKLKKEYDLVYKQREKIQTQYRKDAKVNKDIRKREGNSNLAYIKQLKEINLQKKKLLETDKKLSNSTKKSGNIFQRFGRRVKGALDPATLSAGAFIGAVYGIYTSVKDTIELIKKLDTIELSMKVAFDGDEVALKRTMGSLYLWSIDYGASLLTLTERYNKFVVAAKQSNITLTDTEDIFETITKAAGVMGLRNEELKGSLLAIEQMMSKGKITTEELRRQLGERMPGAMGIMAQAYDKVTRKSGDAVKSQTEMTQALDKAMKKGEVFTADVLPAFAEAMRKAYNLDSIGVIDTLTAAQERSNTAWIKMVEALDNGHGALSKFLKLYYKAKEILAGSFTLFTEEFAGREFFARGVDDAKKYIKGFKEQYKKDYENNTGESLLDTDENDRIIDRARTNEILKKRYDLKILIEEREKQLAVEKELAVNAKYRLERGEELTKEQIEQSKNAKKLGLFLTDNERLGGLEKQYERRFKEVSRLKGELNGFNDEVKINNTELEKTGDAIKEKLYNAKKLIKPLTKDFDKFGKSLKLILKDLADFYKDKSDKAGTYEDALDYKKSELNVRRQILDLTKRQKEADLKTNRDKELAAIDAEILKNKNIAIENANKAQSIIDKLDKNASNYEETVKRIRSQFHTANLEEYNETLKRNKEEVKKKYQYELNYATNVYIQGMNKIERKSVTDRLDIIKGLHDGALDYANSRAKREENDELMALNEMYSKRLDKETNYEEDEKEIHQHYLKEKITRELFALEETYNLAQEKIKNYKPKYTVNDKGLNVLSYDDEFENLKSPEELEALRLQISKAKLEMSNLNREISLNKTKTQKLFNRVLAFVDTYKSVFMDMVNSIGEAIDQSYQRDIDAQDGRLDRLQKYYDKQRELAGDNALKKKLLDEEQAVEEEKIEARKKVLLRKQAKAKKKFAIFNTIVDGASAVISALTVKPPAGAILAAMAAATTATQLAMLRKQSIPEYKHGTPLGGHKKDGIALVGDGGVQEVVHEPGKKPFLTPDTPTYMYLRRKTNVYKSKSDFIKKSINKNMINSNKNDTFVIDDNGIKSAIIKGFSQSNINNSINISIQNNNPYKAFKKL